MTRSLVLALTAIACKSPAPGVVDAAPTTDGPLALDGPNDAAFQSTGFTIQISESKIGANGHTRREVLAIGFAPDGSLLTDDVVITLDRASAGTLGTDHLTLGALGARTSFTPCEQSTPGCLGPAHLALARSSAPGVALATVELQLIAPTDVSTVAPCATGGEMFYLDGADDLVYDMYRVDNASWVFDNSRLNVVSAYGMPVDPRMGVTYDFEIESDYAAQVPFTVGTFTGLHSPSPQVPGPSLEPALNGAGCYDFTGAFQVHAVTLDSTQHVTAITVTFEKTCTAVAGQPARQLEGCFHYGP